jgi:hypothetical protein
MLLAMMYHHRGVLPVSSLATVYTFGAPSVFCMAADTPPPPPPPPPQPSSLSSPSQSAATPHHSTAAQSAGSEQDCEPQSQFQQQQPQQQLQAMWRRAWGGSVSQPDQHTRSERSKERTATRHHTRASDAPAASGQQHDAKQGLLQEGDNGARRHGHGHNHGHGHPLKLHPSSSKVRPE